MKKFKRIAALALALVMLVTALAGCGAKGKEELKGVTEDTILVGNTAGTTGALATIGGPFNIGIEAAFAAYNAAGGFNGKSVKLQHYDDGGVAANSVTLTEQLIHEDEVFAIVGNFASNCVAANLPVIKEANVPMVYAAAGNDELLNEKAEGAERGIFPVQPLNFTEGRMMILRAFAPADNGGLAGTKVGVLSNTVEASQTMLKGIQAEAAELGSKKDSIVYQNVTSSDYSAAVSALKNAGCNVVVVTVIGADFTSALTAMANANYYVPVLTSYNNANAGVLNDPATTLLASQYTDVIANIPIFAQAWLDITSTEYYYNKADSALLKNYETLGLAQAGVGMPGFKEEYWAVAENIYNYCVGQGMANAFAMSYDSYALAGYIAGDLFCQGLKELQAKGKDLTRANYVDIMESKEFQVAMADKISFANGMRSGVQSFALTMFYDAFTVNNGAYHSAASVTVHGLTSIEEYRTLVKG
ncbi:MAG: ABC transporter substrate-binding protein [Oscillospiraceae bacterium]|nr:ABC transporter substrate-binding protein [Oscillospiraceae bacterium]